MQVTGTDRRDFLKATLALALPIEALGIQSSEEPGKQLLASSYRHAQTGNYGLAVCDSHGRLLRHEALPSRGHACVFRPAAQELVTFARRPGRFMQIVDLSRNKPILHISSLPDRHYYGHGCFNNTARLLYSTENDFDNARGVIGIYDASRQYRRVGEFESYGVGPHELVLHPDGQTLIVANGGIETHPQYGREKLNLNQMQSSIAFIDCRDGRLIAKHHLPVQYQKLSLRHLAVNVSGQCVFGAQNNGEQQQLPPLIGSACQEKGLVLFHSTVEQAALQKNYISSVCSVPNSELFAATSSRGGVIVLIDAPDQSLRRLIKKADASGIVASGQSLVCASGNGSIDTFGIYAEHSRPNLSSDYSDMHWDNHLSVS